VSRPDSNHVPLKHKSEKKIVLSLSLSMRESVSRLYVADINLNLLPASECNMEVSGEKQ
jgi:hypothetical protein